MANDIGTYLWQDEDGVNESDNAEAHEDNVGPPGDGLEHDGGDECDGKVHQPAVEDERQYGF